MNKAYLLVICLIAASFTGCTEDVKDDSPVEEILYEGDETGECSDEADNDKDGLFDCDDDQCAGSPACKAEDKPKDEKNNTEETDLVKVGMKVTLLTILILQIKKEVISNCMAYQLILSYLHFQHHGTQMEKPFLVGKKIVLHGKRMPPIILQTL